MPNDRLIKAWINPLAFIEVDFPSAGEPDADAILSFLCRPEMPADIKSLVKRYKKISTGPTLSVVPLERRILDKLVWPLPARGESPAAFEPRCIPPDCVVRRLHMPNMRPPHALSGGRLAALGATRGFATGCYGTRRLLHHSDRGSPYASEDYQAVLTAHGMLGSMSRRGDCRDNAVMESSTVKLELGEHFETGGEAKMELFDYIEALYNQRRRHSTLGQISPAEFERRRQAPAA